MNTKKLLTVVALQLLLYTGLFAQSGGGFVIEQSVIANGGGTISNGSFTVGSTIAQTGVGSPMAFDPFGLTPGFWDPLFAPTAARASLSGRVLLTTGGGIIGASVTCLGPDGGFRTVRASTFGYYHFDNLQVGETYVISVRAKRASFEPRAVTVLDDVAGFDLIAEPQ